MYDEKFSNSPQFYVAPVELNNSFGQSKVYARISELFLQVCEQYGYIFGESEEINLKPPVVAYIVNELQKYSLLDTDFDYKGQAYEEIVGSNSRGERGEFFTPRNLCALAVDMVLALVGPEALLQKRVLDPACGTGGFLRTYIHRVYQIILDREVKKWGSGEKSENNAKEALRVLCDKNIIGIDFNPVLVRAAQMNLVMHGDGSSNIFHENALLSWGEWDDRTRFKVKEGTLDVIISNPPFGEDLLVDDPHILGQYALSTYGSKGSRGAMAPQELFMERCHRLLKNDGLLAIVTPDNILSNPSYKFMRRWIVTHYRMIASVWLPGEMFQPSTGTQTSLLILRKRATPFKSLAKLTESSSGESVFLSVPKRIGHDQRGCFVAKRDDDGDIVFSEKLKKRFIRTSAGAWIEESFVVSEPVANDDLPQVLEDFKIWLLEHGEVR